MGAALLEISPRRVAAYLGLIGPSHSLARGQRMTAREGVVGGVEKVA
jgi:hypothetical protein